MIRYDLHAWISQFWLSIPQYTQYNILVNKILVFTWKESDVIVFYQNLKQMASCLDIIANYSHVM